MRRALLIALLALVPAMFVVVPAAAHSPADPGAAEIVVAELTHAISAAPAPVTMPWVAVVLAAVIAGAMVRRPRRALALLLAIIGLVLAFETGVHSAHHLGEETTSCTVASVSGQLSGTVHEMVVYTSPHVVHATAVAELDVTPFVARVLSPDAGRAPPLPSA